MDARQRAGQAEKQEYLEALEEERRKIEVFHRELPLCLSLVTQTIESARQQVECVGGEHSQAASRKLPVLDEFIPLRLSLSSSSETTQNKGKQEEAGLLQTIERSEGKPAADWLQSAQLWNQEPHPATLQAAVGARSEMAAPPLERATGKPDEEKEKDGDQPQHLAEYSRKGRRCWTPELHRKFVYALQQLGGADAATPKQIRNIMRVDDLTNDEVKSHLQKYRLHTKRTSSIARSSSNNGAAVTQFVVVGDVWAPPLDCASDAAHAIDFPRPLSEECPLSSGSRGPQQQVQQSRRQSNRSSDRPLISDGGSCRHGKGKEDNNGTNSTTLSTSSSSHTSVSPSLHL